MAKNFQGVKKAHFAAEKIASALLFQAFTTQ